MSYYRDLHNPEAVHFPAQLHVVAAYALILLAIVLAVVLSLIYDKGTKLLTDLAEVLACLAIAASYYPRTITTDETGIRISGRLSPRKRLIRWNDVQSVKERAVVPGILAFDAGFLGNWVIEIRSNLPEPPIRFTCRHSGKKAFLYELKHRGAPVPGQLFPLEPDSRTWASSTRGE